jgi:hypothetical protein
VCPLCGADQTRPVEITNSPQPRTLTSFLHGWGAVIAIILVGVGGMAGIFWLNLGEPSTSPALQAAGTAAKSLRDVREALSSYALSEDAYPATLESLGDRASLPMQAALSAGYKLQYSPQPSQGVYRGFVILARPEKSDYVNLYIDESGVIRATPENHPATVQDPPL